ncbi:MAG: flippase-like domain-containing protein [bacterium]|nr:flippase-like domain-containing protein [bacterium]
MNRKVIVNIIVALLASISVILAINSAFKEKVSLLDLLRRDALELIAIGLIVNAVCIFIDGFKLRLLLTSLREDVRYLDALESCFLYSFFSAITPSSMGGQPFQVYFLTKKGVRSETATNIIIFRTFEYLMIVLGIDIYAIIFVLPYLPQWNIGKTMLILGFASSLLSTILTWLAMAKPDMFKYIIVRLKKIKKLENFIGKWEEKAYIWIDNLKLSFYELRKNKRIILIDFSLMVVLILMYSYLLFLPIVGLTGLKINFLKFFSIQILLSSLASYIPTPGASGGIEAIFYTFFKAAAFSPKSLLLGITIYRIATHYSIILIGIPLVFKNKGLIIGGKGER